MTLYQILKNEKSIVERQQTSDLNNGNKEGYVYSKGQLDLIKSLMERIENGGISGIR